MEKWLVNTWSTLQILLLAASLNALSLTQGWGIAIEWPFDITAESRTTYQWAPVMLLVWVPVAIALMILTSELLNRRQHKMSWDRIPGIFGFPKDLRDPFFLRLRKVSVVGSALVCLYVGWHLLRKCTKAIAYCDGKVVADSMTAHFTHYVSPLIAFGPGPRCRLDGAHAGVTFFPFWEPWLVLIALTAISYYWIRALISNASH